MDKNQINWTKRGLTLKILSKKLDIFFSKYLKKLNKSNQNTKDSGTDNNK